MKEYKKLLIDIITKGNERKDRTKIGTTSIFGASMRIDLTKGFPLLTTKKVPFKSVKSELLWFLAGSTDERTLASMHYGKPVEELVGKKTIWTANADAQGKDLGYVNTDTIKMLGPVYGKQWRAWQGPDGVVDQIEELIKGINEDPYSRRHKVSAWNPGEISKMALPPCHTDFQIYVTPYTSEDRKKEAQGHPEKIKSLLQFINKAPNKSGEEDNIDFTEYDKLWGIKKGKLSCLFNQRSADVFLGSPFNIASYALLTHMIAQVTNYDVDELIYNIGDAHIYNNHKYQVTAQLSRKPMQLCELKLNPEITDINNFTMEDIDIVNYVSHQSIKGEMAV